MKAKSLLVAIIFLVNCTSSHKPSQESPTATKDFLDESIVVTVVDAKGLDGCSYLLETKDGRRLQAINLDDEFKKDGLKLRVHLEPSRGMMSICMAGPMVLVKESVAL